MWQIVPVVCDVWHCSICTDISSHRVPSMVWMRHYRLAKMFLSWGDPHDAIFSLNVFSSYPWSSFYLAVEFHAHWQFLLSVPITEDLCVTAVDKKDCWIYPILLCPPLTVTIQFLQIIALNSQRKILLQTMQWCLCNVI